MKSPRPSHSSRASQSMESFSEASGNRQLCYFVATLAAWLAAFTWQAHAAESSAQNASRAVAASGTLSLQDFLAQVRQGHTGVRGAIENAEGAELRAKEGDLLTAPTVFGTFQYTHDGKPPQIPLYTYDFQNTTIYSVGVSQQTTFGLLAKVSYNQIVLDLDGASFGAFAAGAGSSGGGGFGFPLYTTAATLELTQSIWGNGFGRGVRANLELIEAQAMASSYANRYAVRATLADAESAYWRLATARQAVELTQDNLERAKKTHEWSSRRARLQLADRSDELQAQAQLNARRLEHQRALDDERVAAHAFNSARGINSDSVEDRLVALTPEMVQRLQPPRRAQQRDDVKAAEQQSRAAAAGANVALERDTPTLDVFGSLSLNGQSPDRGTSFAQTASFVNPTTAIGVKFQAPLAFGLAGSTRAGYRREQDAADLNYQRRVFDQDQTWQDLNRRLAESKARLKLAHELEKTQQAKLFNEQKRLQSGRSTAFTVLTFETDYAVAQLGRIQTQSEVLGILTQMKLFGEEL